MLKILHKKVETRWNGAENGERMLEKIGQLTCGWEICEGEKELSKNWQDCGLKLLQLDQS